MYENTCLKGLHVLDVTHFLAGPTVSQTLSDLGAEVVKVERIGTGDAGRGYAPIKEGESGWYCAFNRNKHSITLNYTKPEGKEIFLELAKWADVIVENNAPGVLKKYGLGYEDIAKINPGIVYASITGYGHKDSPYVYDPALDGVAQAFGGLISSNGLPGVPGVDPGVKVGPGVIDLVSGYMATIGILSALYERNISGLGQHIDTCMVDATLNLLENAITDYSFTGKGQERFGNGHYALGMTGCFDTLDGKASIYVNSSNDKLAFLMFDAIGRPELKDDPRCNSNPARHENRYWLDPLVNEYTSKKTRAELIKEFKALGIAVGPVNTVEDCWKEPHFWERREIREVEHPTLGKYAVTMTPFHCSRTPLVEPKAAESLGQSNDMVYGGILGKSAEEMAALKEKGIIG